LEWSQDICPVDDFLCHFNSQSEQTKFTIELEKDKSLAFLDVLVRRDNDNKITTSVYRKPTESGLCLQYDSNHPKPVKNGVVNNLLHRASTHCHDELEYKKEVEKVKLILINNKYPESLINSIIKARERKHTKKKVDEKPHATVILPYMPLLGEKIKRIGKNCNIRVVFSSKETMRAELVRFKPKSKTIKKDVIYKIPCECSKSYIGETGRALETRLSEHQRNLKKGDPEVSKLCEHHFNTGHRFLWDQTKIIGREQNIIARRFHEAAEIMRGGDWVMSTPLFNIDPIWRPMIKDIKLFPKKKNVNEAPVRLRRSQRVIEKNTRATLPPKRQRGRPRGVVAEAALNSRARRQ
jgi:hypothetical protein